MSMNSFNNTTTYGSFKKNNHGYNIVNKNYVT